MIIHIFHNIFTVFSKWVYYHNVILESALWFFFLAGMLRRFHLFYSFFLILSTIFHEMMHFLVALIFFGKPNSFNIIPEFTENGLILGSVECLGITTFNAIQIGLAPLLLIPICYIYVNIINIYIINPTFYVNMLNGYIVFSLLSGSIPSYVDFRMAFVDGLVALVFVSAVSFVLLNFHF